MKLISALNSASKERMGIFVSGKVILFEEVDPQKLPLTMGDFLADVARYTKAIEEALPLMEKKGESTYSKLLSPVPHPTSCRDGYAFRQHVETMRRNRGAEMSPEFDLFPVFYYTNHNAVVGEGPIDVQKDHLVQLDFELELAIVIGKKGRNIQAKDADKYILGFTIMNDFSARKLQTEEMKLSLGPAKGKDFATSLGPWLVTPDEIKEYTHSTPHGNQYHLCMSANHNGQNISLGNAKDMNWTFAQIIERASYGVDLYPGDVIGSGTVGTGCYAELNSTAARVAKEKGLESKPVWLQSGDTIELTIEGLGTLKNTIQLQDCPYSILV